MIALKQIVPLCDVQKRLHRQTYWLPEDVEFSMWFWLALDGCLPPSVDDDTSENVCAQKKWSIFMCWKSTLAIFQVETGINLHDGSTCIKCLHGEESLITRPDSGSIIQPVWARMEANAASCRATCKVRTKVKIAASNREGEYCDVHIICDSLFGQTVSLYYACEFAQLHTSFWRASTVRFPCCLWALNCSTAWTTSSRPALRSKCVQSVMSIHPTHGNLSCIIQAS